MQGGNSVYAEAGVNRKPGHINGSVPDNAHAVLFVVIVGEASAQVREKTPVYFFHYLIHARQ